MALLTTERPVNATAYAHECWLKRDGGRLRRRNGLADPTPWGTQRWRATHLWHAPLRGFRQSAPLTVHHAPTLRQPGARAAATRTLRRSNPYHL